MNRDPLRRGLAWGLAATLLLPIILAVTLGTAALLAAVGDAAAAAVCRWLAIPLGGVWIVAVIATTALSAATQLAAGTGRRRWPRGRRRRGVGDRQGD
jgi:hypothetical protein